MRLALACAVAQGADVFLLDEPTNHLDSVVARFKGLGVWGLGFRGLGFRGLGFRGLGFRVSGLELRVFDQALEGPMSKDSLCRLAESLMKGQLATGAFGQGVGYSV